MNAIDLPTREFYKKVVHLVYSSFKVPVTDDRTATQLKMSLKSFLLVLVIATTAYSQAAQNFDFAEFKRCARLSVERTCTNNFAYVSDLLETLVNCGQEFSARVAARYCERDEQSGLYCGAAGAYTVDAGAASFFCGSALQPGGQCSADCRRSLMSIRDDLGCCIKAFLNGTATSTPVLSSTLWSICDLEPPNSACVGELPFTLPTTPLQECTSDEIYLCREADINEFRNSITGEPASCEVVLQASLDRCSHKDASDDGFCTDELGFDAALRIPSLASDCGVAIPGRTPSACSSTCRESLEEFADRRGCCINTLYNSTYSVVTGLNYTITIFQDSTLFNLCDVDTPPLTCTESDGSLPLKGFTLMMLLPLIIVLLGNN